MTVMATLRQAQGNLVKKINPNGSKTLYVGGIYEVDKASGGSVTRTVTYYPVGGAMRINNTLYYILKDHLGSASVVTDSSGVEVGEQRYYPFGEARLATGNIYTDKLYTGQREMAGLGIYHYGSRFYSPKLGRFLSADTIVPGDANPQAFNRYSYVLNNPLRYIDPSGNIPIDCIGDPGYCEGTPAPTPTPTPTPTPSPSPAPSLPCTNPTNNCSTTIAAPTTATAYQPTYSAWACQNILQGCIGQIPSTSTPQPPPTPFLYDVVNNPGVQDIVSNTFPSFLSGPHPLDANQFWDDILQTVSVWLGYPASSLNQIINTVVNPVVMQ